MVRKIGVLALQGAFQRHIEALKSCGTEPFEVRTPKDLDNLDAVIFPGGESTTVGKLLISSGLLAPLQQLLFDGFPALGTCAGMILLSREILDPAYPGQPLLGVCDISVRRNAFGRQIDSFEADLEINGMDNGLFRGIFIRAPWVERWKDEVEVLAWQNERAVMVRQGPILLSAFHPELTNDRRVHEMFLEMCK